MKKITMLALTAGIALISLASVVWTLNIKGDPDISTPVAVAAPSDALLARGANLARAGNCMTCHTARGGASYAGGRAIDTPFGAVFTSNLTPDEKTGIGSWTSAHFWRAMHNGRSKSGRLLYPAFPYTSYTQVTREDSDALFAYLGSLLAVVQPNRTHDLQFPFQSQAALAIWRAMYFKPGEYVPDPQRNSEWNRGAYLVKGLGHCSACHTARNALGATDGLDLAGGLIPMQNWYAPSLTSPHEAGMGEFKREDIERLLKTGLSAGTGSSASETVTVTGPMAEVVLNSTQYLSPEDLSAMAQYLKELPAMRPQPVPKPAAVPFISNATAARGAKIYEQQCAQCHGDTGQGVPNAYPALAGNRAVTMKQTVNLVQIVLNGGYAPATAGNPRPYGMPPFVLTLNDTDVAAVLTHLRSAWGNQASVVTPLEVNRIRAQSGR